MVKIEKSFLIVASFFTSLFLVADNDPCYPSTSDACSDYTLALRKAIEEQDMPQVLALIQKKVDGNSDKDMRTECHEDVMGEIHHKLDSFANNDKFVSEVVRAYSKSGSDLDDANQYKEQKRTTAYPYRPLDMAICKGKVLTAAELCSAGADINKDVPGEKGLLEKAVDHNRSGSVEFCLGKGAIVTDAALALNNKALDFVAKLIKRDGAIECLQDYLRRAVAIEELLKKAAKK